MLTQSALKEHLSYDPERGIFTRLAACKRGDRIGQEAGHIDQSSGYRKISIGNKRYYAHRLAWLYVHGEWPPEQIDHANLNRSDNRFVNLRLATNGQNNANSRPRRSGLKGATFHKGAGKWCAQIGSEARNIYLGLFDTEEEAHAAYCAAARELFGEFHRDPHRLNRGIEAMARCPFSIWHPLGGSAGKFTSGPFKIVHHTTESSSTSGSLSELGHKHVESHFVVDDKNIYQLIDTSVAAKSLRNSPGGVETNRDSAVQIEMVGFAGKPKNPATLANVRRLCRWLEKEHNIPRVWPNGYPKPAVNGKDPGGHNRNAHNWDTMGGHYGHCHVPENCVSVETPILCADLIWRPAGDLKPGDELIAFDEENTESWGRKLRRSIVVNNKPLPDALLAVHTVAGSVKCNHEHPWLAKRAGRSQWVRACDLEPGDDVWWFGAPWQVERSWEAGWLAGMYDGEGCISHYKNRTNILVMSQRVSPTAETMVRLLEERVEGTLSVINRNFGPNKTDMVQVQIASRWGVLRMLGAIRPPRLLADSTKVWDGGSANRSRCLVPVESVKDAGTGVIASLETSTKTYIANGFAMHNTHWDPAYTKEEVEFIMQDEQTA